jgi:hypothetical protein
MAAKTFSQKTEKMLDKAKIICYNNQAVKKQYRILKTAGRANAQ